MKKDESTPKKMKQEVVEKVHGRCFSSIFVLVVCDVVCDWLKPTKDKEETTGLFSTCNFVWVRASVGL